MDGQRKGRDESFSVRGPCLACAVSVLAAVTTLMLSACGLPTASYLAPPENPLIGLSNTLTFQNDTTNDIDNFSGYELYYRFYTYTTTGLNQLTTDQATITSSTTASTALLTSLGYLPILPNLDPNNLSRTLPLIPFDSTQKAQALTVTLNFLGSSTEVIDATAQLSDGSSAITLKRNYPSLTDASGNLVLKSFLTDNYDSTDNDVQAMGVSLSGSLYLAVVAISYGTDLTTLSAIYSTPTFLGYVTLDYQYWATQPEQ